MNKTYQHWFDPQWNPSDGIKEITMITDTAPTHSRLSPSKAYQWTVCTASIPFAEANKDRLPPDTAGPAAIEGTKAHAVAEAYVLGTKIPAYATKDMKSYGKAYAEFCQEVMGPKPDLIDWGVEERVPLSYLPEEKGTVDFWCWNKKGLHLVDYKYGYDPVDSVGNKQMAIYAWSLYCRLRKDQWMYSRDVLRECTHVTMTIFQPRTPDEMTTWEISIEELARFMATEIAPHAADIQKGKSGVFAPSDKVCKYCRAASICKARADFLVGDFNHLLEDDTPPPAVQSLDDKFIMRAYHKAPQIKAWLDSITEATNKKVLAGQKVPGLKVVLSNGGHRFWTDPVAVERLLMANGFAYDDIHDVKLISPAATDKLTKKSKGAWVQQLYSLQKKPEGSPIVVPESDPRRDYKEDVTEDFLHLDEDWS